MAKKNGKNSKDEVTEVAKEPATTQEQVEALITRNRPILPHHFIEELRAILFPVSPVESTEETDEENES